MTDVAARCRVFAERDAARQGLWSFFVGNEGVRPIDLVVLSEITTEWGDRSARTPVGVRIADLAPGTAARIWQDDGSGDTELRMTLHFRVEAAGSRADLRFVFPRLYRVAEARVAGTPE